MTVTLVHPERVDRIDARTAAAPAGWVRTEFWRTEPSWVVERRLIEERDRVIAHRPVDTSTRPHRRAGPAVPVAGGARRGS